MESRIRSAKDSAENPPNYKTGKTHVFLKVPVIFTLILWGDIHTQKWDQPWEAFEKESRNRANDQRAKNISRVSINSKAKLAWEEEVYSHINSLQGEYHANDIPYHPTP